MKSDQSGGKPHPRYLCTRISLLCALGLVATGRLTANQGEPPKSLVEPVLPLSAVQQLALPPTEPAAELAADAKAGRNLPLHYAVAIPTRATPAEVGTWEQLPEGRLWRLRIASSGATDLNLGFTKFWLPEGASLHVVSESEKYYQGPYTAADNQPAEQLWTPVVPGQAVVIELFVPTRATQQPRLELTQVGAGYRDLFHRRKDLATAKAESCELDVVCPQGAAWTNEIRSVARISIAGTYLCSGTLIMDAPRDFRAFFLTANHCGITAANASTVVVYWNYQSPACGMCGFGASSTNTQSGAAFRAAKSDVDFCLIELNQLPPTNYNVYYAGWDRSGTAPAGCVGIHHPRGDGKCISFSTNPLTTVNSCIGTGGSSTHWQVLWSQAVTEPGSSGSGIWDSATHLVVGTLSGGGSDCLTPDSPDCYGKVSVAWASGSSPSSRLSDWLDPQNTGVTTVPGAYSAPVPGIVAAGATLAAEGCPPGNSVVDPGEVVTMNFALQNAGTGPTTNLVATLAATNGVLAPSAPQSYGALAPNSSAVTRCFTFMASGVYGGTLTPTLQLQDGAANLGTLSFSLRLGVPNISLAQNFDGVTPPALPAGWTSSPAGAWVTTTAQRDSAPNCAFASDPDSTSDEQLISPGIPILTTNAQLSFRHYYSTESGYDGCVLEVSVNGGAFSDILNAGGSFASGAYDTTIPFGYGNPLALRSGWSGASPGFITTTANLPASAAGQTLQFRWRLGSDSSYSGTGWYVDSISLSDGWTGCVGAPRPVLGSASYDAHQGFHLELTGGSGYRYSIEASTNLTDWTSLTTNTSPFSFTDTNTSPFPNRYYGARYRP